MLKEKTVGDEHISEHITYDIGCISLKILKETEYSKFLLWHFLLLLYFQ